jgi:deoxyribose-phosphate aldolase
MFLTASEIAKIIDLSCVRTWSNQADIEEMVTAAKTYRFGQVSVLQCFIPYTRQLLGKDSPIHIVGNVSFPTGSDTTSVKVHQAEEMKAAGCDEIDMVMNIGQLLSGNVAEVEKDVRAVARAVQPLPLKVIIEIMYLSPAQVMEACRICLASGAAFIKTGTGWADRGTTLEDIKLIKSIVGDQIKIKASGGIRDLDTLVAMYHAGARRFGVNLKSGIEIVQQARQNPDGIEIDPPQKEN